MEKTSPSFLVTKGQSGNMPFRRGQELSKRGSEGLDIRGRLRSGRAAGQASAARDWLEVPVARHKPCTENGATDSGGGT